jgi:signal transduction histidine kinase
MNTSQVSTRGKLHPLRTRLVLSYLAVILIGMGIASPLAWLAVERLYLENQKANLLSQSELIADTLEFDSGQLNDSTAGTYSQLSNIQPGIHTRVINPQGAIIISLTGPGQPADRSGFDLPQFAQNSTGDVTPDELLNRPEIEEALQGQAAVDVRRVDVPGGRPVLYAAAPVYSEDGSIAGIVYLASPLPDTQWAALPVIVRWQLIGVILAAILVASGFGLLFARRISNPLGRLAEGAQAVAGGDLSQYVSEDPDIAELSSLGRAFNSMTASLQKSEQVKNAFIADVTHELRTPLTVIKGTVETLQDGAMDDLTIREPFLDSMSRETERLIRLVNDLLVLTRADSNALNLKLQPYDLWELARSRCTHMQPFASQYQVRLLVDTGLNSAGYCNQVLIDPDRIAQVLDNLLDNAIRYSPPGSDIKVVLDHEREEVGCRVIDSGPGIPAEHLPYIFERFYRVDPARERSQGGSGLGLAIVRGLILAHNGRVSASSEEGVGTTLTFWLPAISG